MSSTIHLKKIAALLWMCLLGLTGCRQEVERPEGLPELYPVVLEITQAGMPLPDANIVLYPTETDANRWVSGGGTDAQGKALIRTHGQFAGCPAGSYKVCVTKTEIERNATASPSANPGEPLRAKVWNLVDRKYQSPATTPTEIKVEASSKNQFEPIDVGDIVRKQRKSI